ncbi:MAG TPA: hypothetical protein ENI18_09800 [Candidatus Aminicenantes bacterium]|nr:hypothetical protein [Candidatus Aminicenantes bacterium]
MKDKKQIDLTAENAVAKLTFEMGLEILKPALKNHKHAFEGLMKKWIKGSITNKEIFDQLIKLII